MDYKINFFSKIAKLLQCVFCNAKHSFAGSAKYWEGRYKARGTSGAGSYNKLAEFKANIINNFVEASLIKTVIEYGCGDGNQLKLSKYPSYIGFDVSSEAVAICARLFSNDHSKTFKLLDEYDGELADLTLSLDVIYHLVEDDVFHAYMKLLFESSRQYVIIYSSNKQRQAIFQNAHVKHRRFSEWIDLHKPEWQLTQVIPNKYPYSITNLKGSFAEFYIYKLSNNT